MNPLGISQSCCGTNSFWLCSLHFWDSFVGKGISISFTHKGVKLANKSSKSGGILFFKSADPDNGTTLFFKDLISWNFPALTFYVLTNKSTQQAFFAFLQKICNQWGGKYIHIILYVLELIMKTNWGRSWSPFWHLSKKKKVKYYCQINFLFLRKKIHLSRLNYERLTSLYPWIELFFMLFCIRHILQSKKKHSTSFTGKSVKGVV